MLDKMDMVTITKEEYNELCNIRSWLNCLEVAGVDNWEGYSYAKDLASNIMEV